MHITLLRSRSNCIFSCFPILFGVLILMIFVSPQAVLFGAHTRQDVSQEVLEAETDALVQKLALRAMGQEELSDRLAEMRAKEIRDNGMVHYLLSQTYPVPEISPREKELINQTIDEGWTSESGALLPLLAAYDPVFAEIRRGVALDYAHGVDPFNGCMTPFMNYLQIQSAARLMCAQARRYQYNRDMAGALDNCLAVITLGRDLGTAPSPVIGQLVGMSTSAGGLRTLYGLISSGKMERAALEKTLDRLVQIQRTQPRMTDALKWERDAILKTMAMVEENPDLFREQIESDEMMKEAGITFEDVSAQKARIDADILKQYDLMIEYCALPAHERNPEEFRQKVNEHEKVVHPIVAMGITAAQAESLSASDCMNQCRVGGVILLIALELYRGDFTAYPANLAALVPRYIEQVPLEPFSGQAFHYERLRDGLSYRLYAVKPDRQEGNGEALFEYQSGMANAGAILFQ